MAEKLYLRSYEWVPHDGTYACNGNNGKPCQYGKQAILEKDKCFPRCRCGGLYWKEVSQNPA
ncbi:MAG: hypothetical protein WCT27_04190 [Patescibacteria group bacterium]